MKTTEYLDAVKRERDLPSDYALAKALGITREAVSALRKGKSCMGIETCMKVADILGIDEHVVYSHAQIERSKTPELLMFWTSVSEKFSASFNALLLETGLTTRRRVLS